MWAAIVAFFKAFGPLITRLVQLLVGLIDMLVGYFILKKQRIKNAIEEEIEAKKQAAIRQKAKEAANIKAFKAIEQQAWKDRYEQILKFIKAKEYDKVIILREEVDNPNVDNVLFDEKLSDEYKAVKIIGIMKNNNKLDPNK